MKRYRILWLVLLVALFNNSCVKRKCRDASATNAAFFSSGPSENSLCVYSKVVFYTTSGYYLNDPINKIEIYINQVYIGDVTSVYASSPGNCSASGTVSYQFVDKNPVDWEAKIILTNGQIYYTNGILSPSSSSCLIQDIMM
ncbi:MAG: hypothetical protein ACKO4Y_01500 [Flavobacteriales bacterium]